MGNSSGQVLKGNNVKLEGQFRLDAGQTPTGSQNKTNITSTQANVHIVENNSEFAVVEVTCGCGTKIHIRCEYADSQANE